MMAKKGGDPAVGLMVYTVKKTDDGDARKRFHLYL
jgi:hypothetical protein